MSQDIKTTYFLCQRGANLLTTQAQDLLAIFLQSLQMPDGGFIGRNSKTSDVYYTYFAVATLLSLGRKFNLPQVKHFLEQAVEIFQVHIDISSINQNIPDAPINFPRDIVHGVALGRCCLLLGMEEQANKILCHLLQYQNNDGGYSYEQKTSTLYETFLMAQFCEEAEKKMQPSDPSAFLAQFQVNEGFANHQTLPIAVTTTTSAFLVLARKWQIPYPDKTFTWLMQQQHPLGGWRANPFIPNADPLSTVSALYAIYHWGIPLFPDWVLLCEEFLMSHWQTSGGFAETPQEVADSEYCFYTLLSLGCLT